MDKIGKWLSAALEDPNVCKEMKKDIIEWFENGGDDFNDTINRLRAEIERKDEALMQISGWFYMPSLGDDAEGHLRAVQEIARQALQNNEEL